MSACPSAESIAAFVDGQLGDADVQRLDEHVAACVECRAVIAALGADLHDGGSTIEVSIAPQALEAISTGRLAEIMANARVGEVVDETWRLEGVLGAGGMGQVFEAVHVEDGTRAALKLLRGELAHSQEIVRRFEREQQAARRIEHPAFVRVLSHGVAKGGEPYFVMDLVEGHTLRALVRTEGPLGEPRVLEIGVALLEALAVAHAANVLHRDVKPDNLALDADGRLRILDFGIARISAETEHATTGGATQTGQMLGTPAYMPPEQARAIPSEIDERVDVFATAATLVYLLTGRGIRPAAGTLFEAMTQPVAKVATLAPAVSSGLARVLDRALSFDKRDRFRSALAMRDALLAPPAEDIIDVALTTADLAPRPRRRVALVLGALALIAAVPIALLLHRATPPVWAAPAPVPCAPVIAVEPVVSSPPRASSVPVPASAPPPPIRPPASRPRPPARRADPLERRQ